MVFASKREKGNITTLVRQAKKRRKDSTAEVLCLQE
jgi:hypothetical protein